MNRIPFPEPIHHAPEPVHCTLEMGFHAPKDVWIFGEENPYTLCWGTDFCEFHQGTLGWRVELIFCITMVPYLGWSPTFHTKTVLKCIWLRHMFFDKCIASGMTWQEVDKKPLSSFLNTYKLARQQNVKNKTQMMRRITKTTLYTYCFSHFVNVLVRITISVLELCTKGSLSLGETPVLTNNRDWKKM